MDSNFTYLKKEDKYHSFVAPCIEAEQLMNVSYSAAATYARRAMELAVRWLYANDEALRLPYNDTFVALINGADFKEIVGEDLYKAVNFTRELGNKAVHTTMAVDRNQAALSLRNLFNFTHFIDYCYSEDYEERAFDERLLGYNDRIKKSQEEHNSLKKVLSKKDQDLKHLIAENESLRAENEKIREKNEQRRAYQPDQLSEAETRKAYIDLQLEMQGWVLGANCLEEVQVFHMPNGSNTGYVDYVLYGDNGKPLGLIEAKKTAISPKLGKNQAALYADALEVETGIRPVIFYTNGIDYYIWDDESNPPRKVSGIYSKRDLESLYFLRENKRSLKNLDIKEEITNRAYQIEAITRTLESYEAGHRRALLVMATGSGKTRTAASIVDLMVRRNWAKNILFLADRTALVKQAKESFGDYLPTLSLCNLLDNKDDVNSRVIFSTYPTMMNAIDEKRGVDGEKLFTPGHFDLIILDESHRSIYKKYQDIFDYFDARLLGLTATPVNDIDRNTYRIFGLEENNPTFAYELDKAIDEGYLVPYELPQVPISKFMESGIIYDELSPEEKADFEETFVTVDDIPKEMLNKSLFNIDTVDVVLKDVMARGLKVEGGDKLGKTIIFAANRRHADFIVERFDALYPEYKGKFAGAIYHSIAYVDNLIDCFKDKNGYPQIAVSVDMLDTGIDVPEILNLVFFKQVFSKAKFWQMIGRGTRLCKDLFGPGEDKEKFYIFDYCGNFEFFGNQPGGKEVSRQVSLTEKIFAQKIEMIQALEHADYQEAELAEYRQALIDDVLFAIKSINQNRFSANMRLHMIDRYSNKEAFKSLTEKDIKDLKEHIAPLLISTDEDEMAKRFDYLIYRIEHSLLRKKTATDATTRVRQTAFELAKKGSIPEVQKHKDLINRMQSEEFWHNVSVLELENIRQSLRDLIKLIDRQEQEIFYTDFTDSISRVDEPQSIYTVNDLEAYKKRIHSYFEEHRDETSIYKLRNNKELTPTDIQYFEDLLFNKLGDRSSYEKAYQNKPLLKLVSEVAGMDRQAASEAFAKFLSDESLNANQINFVEQIIDYVVENGSIERAVLQEYPFNQHGGITYIFSNKLNTVKEITLVINQINDRLTI